MSIVEERMSVAGFPGAIRTHPVRGRIMVGQSDVVEEVLSSFAYCRRARTA
ncbi:MAG: hypothetical protein R2848_08065 [Thermomicrobiales bacterium]